MFKPLATLPPVSRDPGDILKLFGPQSQLIQNLAKRALGVDRPILGTDLEYRETVRYVEEPTVLGVSDGYLTVSVPFDEGLAFFKELRARHPNILFVGHAFTSADKFAFRQVGEVINLEDIEDTIIRFFLTNAHLCKTGTKVEDGDGEKRGKGYMNLWTFLSLYTDFYNYKDCWGPSCRGEFCPKHDVWGYNGADSSGPIYAIPQILTQSKIRGVDKLYPLHRELAYVLGEMSRYGVQVDREYLFGKGDGSTRGLQGDFEFNKQRIEESLPFNPKSNKAALAYFKGKGIELKDWTEDTIRKGVEEYEDEELELCLDYKELGNGVARWFAPSTKNKAGEWEGYMDGNGKIHPRLGQFTSTGRLQCVAKGTLIEIVRDVSKFPKGVPIEDVKEGDLAYSFSNDGELKIKKVSWAGKTGEKNVVFLYWRSRNGKYRGKLELTEDHLIKCTDGIFRPVKELAPGDGVFSLSRGINQDGYALLYPSGYPSHEAIREHRFIFKEMIGEEGENVHHKDENKLNNVFGNLENLSKAEHLAEHRDGYKSKFASAQKSLWKSNREERLKKCISRGSDHKRWLGLKKDWLISELKKHIGPTRAARNNNIDFSTFKKYMELNGVIWDRKTKKVGLEQNHVVERIEYTDKVVEVYDLTVEDTHNYIAGEICAHNCTSPNLQNVAKRRVDRHVCECGVKKEEHDSLDHPFSGASLGKMVRRAIIASPGYYLLKADLSNGENRVILHLGGHRIPNEVDLHSKVVEMAKLTPDMEFSIKMGGPREAAKSIAHASHYAEGIQLKYPSEIRTARTKAEVDAGARIVFPEWIFNGKIVTFTGSNLARRVFGDASWENRAKALEVVNKYFTGFPGARELQKKVFRDIEKNKAVITPHGYYLLSFGEDTDRCKTALAMIGSNPVAHVTKLALVDLWRKFQNGSPLRPILQIHDEIICEVPLGFPPDKAAALLRESMEIETREIPGLILPIGNPSKGELASYGPNWNQMKAVKI